VEPCFSRRALLAAGGAALGAVTPAACSGGPDVPQLTAVGPGGVVARLAEVPPDGAYQLVLDGRRTLITQPAAGTVAAFDAECPHQGCAVKPLEGGGLGCPCHGSRFDPATGAVLQGPATSPLAPIGVAVRGDDVVLT
jgi:Rieske Fe-S protein